MVGVDSIDKFNKSIRSEDIVIAVHGSSRSSAGRSQGINLTFTQTLKQLQKLYIKQIDIK